MFRFQPDTPHAMPAHFGTYHTALSSPIYPDAWGMAIGYVTEKEKLRRYIPEPFEIEGDPIVALSYTQNHGVAWMAGRGYNIVTVNIPCRFNGDKEQVDGAFALVLWENDTDPILVGRESLGVPKVYADIEDHAIVDGVWRTAASVRCRTFFEMEICDLQEVDESGLDQMYEASKNSNWMAWRYVPPMVGNEGLSHATCIPSATNRPTEAYVGKGEVTWHATTWEKNPTQHHIINALADLPVLEYRYATITRTSLTMSDAHKKPLRALY